MEFYVADSYTGYELVGVPFEKSGKMYSKARCNCDRCVKGIYISRIENGQPVPHQAYGGVCLKCHGTGYLTKEIRLYTEKEKAAADRAKQRAAERKVEKKLQEAAKKKAQWLERNQFNTEGLTAVYVGSNSFDVKAELKEAGWKYSPIFGWRSADVSAIDTYGEDNVAILSADQLVSFNIYGEGCFLSTCGNLIQQLKDARKPQSLSNWVCEVKEKLVDFPVVIQRISGFSSRFGWTNVITFVSGNDILTWLTSSNVSDYEEGEKYLLSATVKEHSTYKDEKQTLLLRVKLK